MLKSFANSRILRERRGAAPPPNRASAVQNPRGRAPARDNAQPDSLAAQPPAAALALLKSLPLKGATVTGDAAVCRRALCKAIRDGGGEYPFAVKANRPGSMAGIAASFGDAFPPVPNSAPGNAAADPPPDVEYAEAVEKGHGRFEIRGVARGGAAPGGPAPLRSAASSGYASAPARSPAARFPAP